MAKIRMTPEEDAKAEANTIALFGADPETAAAEAQAMVDSVIDRAIIFADSFGRFARDGLGKFAVGEVDGSVRIGIALLEDLLNAAEAHIQGE